MGKFTTKQGVLFFSYTLDVEELEKIDRFLSLLDESGVAEVIKSHVLGSKTGRPQYDIYKMLAAVIYGFAQSNGTLRTLEDRCKFDIRFMYIMGGETPSYACFCNFINEVIKPHADEIFSAVTSTIMKKLSLDMDVCFIDGTKIEADANKYKFVWKPITFHKRLGEKARNLLKVAGLDDRGDDGSPLIKSDYLAVKLVELRRKIEKESDPEAKAKKTKMAENLENYMLKACEYEEKERICGPDRNSYYKTDHDATAMCLKTDYYSGLGSNMHAAYQVQAIVSSGYISAYSVSQNRSDTYCFIPAMENFKRFYKRFPKKVCADAGYGCLKNYKFCDENNIEAYVKYMSWEGESTGRRPAVYELNDDDTITCLGGRVGKETEIQGRHPKNAGSVFYLVEGCTGCAFMPYCRQFMKEPVADYKVFEVCREFIRYKQKARDILLSVQGIEMRVNRSCQVEGFFGIMKQDFGYDRFRRTLLKSVSMELMLTALGMNIRKFLNGVSKPKHWKAPPDTKPQQFKKPSAKRLANRARRKKEKQPNEKARDSHKYKK